MKKMIKSLVAGLLSTGCLIAHGETKTVGGQNVTDIETAVVNVCSNPTNNAVLTAAVSDVDRAMIRGKVLIVADERSNKLIIITAKTNIDFFDKVIKSLDVETTPEVSVERKLR